jgi:hypothetical protein
MKQNEAKRAQQNKKREAKRDEKKTKKYFFSFPNKKCKAKLFERNLFGSETKNF